MDRKELAYEKQVLLGVKDWDAFQAVIRHWSKMMKPATHSPGSAKKTR